MATRKATTQSRGTAAAFDIVAEDEFYEELTPARILKIGGFVVAILAVIVIGALPDKGAALVSFVVETFGSFTKALIVGLEALLITYMSQYVRTRKWYDKFGAALELCGVQSRVRAGKDKPGDTQALGLQYLANGIIFAVVFVSLFNLHS